MAGSVFSSLVANTAVLKLLWFLTGRDKQVQEFALAARPRAFILAGAQEEGDADDETRLSGDGQYDSDLTSRVTPADTSDHSRRCICASGAEAVDAKDPPGDQHKASFPAHLALPLLLNNDYFGNPEEVVTFGGCNVECHAFMHTAASDAVNDIAYRRRRGSSHNFEGRSACLAWHKRWLRAQLMKVRAGCSAQSGDRHEPYLFSDQEWETVASAESALVDLVDLARRGEPFARNCVGHLLQAEEVLDAIDEESVAFFRAGSWSSPAEMAADDVAGEVQTKRNVDVLCALLDTIAGAVEDRSERYNTCTCCRLRFVDGIDSIENNGCRFVEKIGRLFLRLCAPRDDAGDDGHGGRVDVGVAEADAISNESLMQKKLKSHCMNALQKFFLSGSWVSLKVLADVAADADLRPSDRLAATEALALLRYLEPGKLREQEVLCAAESSSSGGAATGLFYPSEDADAVLFGRSTSTEATVDDRREARRQSSSHSRRSTSRRATSLADEPAASPSDESSEDSTDSEGESHDGLGAALQDVAVATDHFWPKQQCALSAVAVQVLVWPFLRVALALQNATASRRRSAEGQGQPQMSLHMCRASGLNLFRRMTTIRKKSRPPYWQREERIRGDRRLRMLVYLRLFLGRRVLRNEPLACTTRLWNEAYILYATAGQMLASECPDLVDEVYKYTAVDAADDGAWLEEALFGIECGSERAADNAEGGLDLMLSRGGGARRKRGTNEAETSSIAFLSSSSEGSGPETSSSSSSVSSSEEASAETQMGDGASSREAPLEWPAAGAETGSHETGAVDATIREDNAADEWSTLPKTSDCRSEEEEETTAQSVEPWKEIDIEEMCCRFSDIMYLD